jgi:Protein of unknown function (DUF3617)
VSQCKRSNLFAVCAVGVFLVGSATLLAQLADLPIKAGLWETQVTVKMGSAKTNDEVPVTNHVCFTAGLTVANYMSAMNRSAGVGGAHCTVSNKMETAHGISYDSACVGPTMSSTGHADFKLSNADHFNGTSHTTVTGTAQGKAINTTVDKTFSAKFLSSDCGNVQPTVVPPANGK